MNVREALRKRRWFTYLRTGTDRESAVADFEKGLRAAYREGGLDGTDSHSTLNDDRGVTVGVAAMVEEES